MTSNDTFKSKDSWLADFADQILDGEMDSLPANSPDAETRALADILLRLKHAFPKQELDPASAQRMQTQIMDKWREEQNQTTHWAKIFQSEWMTSSRRQQLGMAFAMLVIASVLIVTVPILFSSNQATTASAGSEVNSMSLWIVLGIAAVLLLWLFRRKS